MSLLKKVFLFVLLLFVLGGGSYVFLRKLGYIPSIRYFFDDASEELALNNQPKHKLISGNDYNNYKVKIEELLDEKTFDGSKISLLIEKSKRRLTLYYDGKPLKSYPVVLGTSSIKDKLKEGDRRTPEGVFHIQCKYIHSSWSRFLCISYPNNDSWRKHLKAKSEGRISIISRVGGQVGIHGVSEGKDKLIDEGINWTWGCISLKRKDINEIYNWVQPGIEVEILH